MLHAKEYYKYKNIFRCAFVNQEDGGRKDKDVFGFGILLTLKSKVLSGKLNDVPSGRLFRADLGSLQIG